MASINELSPGTWNVDTAHSSVAFSARHLMITKVRGRFGSFHGTVSIPEDRLGAKVVAEVDLASVSTGDEGRDNHLRSADFFDVENHPTMAFESTGVYERGDDFILTGDLSIRGVTKPIEFELEFEGVGTDPWGNTKAAFSARTEINRKDWGLEWNVALDTGGVLVSEKVGLQLEIQLVKA
jgi:polyisoprenoid-binding protein YceI